MKMRQIESVVSTHTHTPQKVLPRINAFGGSSLCHDYDVPNLIWVNKRFRNLQRDGSL